MENVMTYQGNKYIVVYNDGDGWVLTVNNYRGWKITSGIGQLSRVPREVYQGYIGKTGWWFAEDIIKQDFKPLSVENV